VHHGYETEDHFMFWDDGNFDDALGFDDEAQIKLKKGLMQTMNCFVEEWEVEAKLKQDAVSEAKILKKV